MGSLHPQPPGVEFIIPAGQSEALVGQDLVGLDFVFFASAAGHFQFFGIRGMGRRASHMRKCPSADQGHPRKVHCLSRSGCGTSGRTSINFDRVAAIVVGVVSDVRHQIPSGDLLESRAVPRTIQGQRIMEGDIVGIRVWPPDAVAGKALGSAGPVVLIDHVIVGTTPREPERVARIKPHHRIPTILNPTVITIVVSIPFCHHRAAGNIAIPSPFQSRPQADAEQQAGTRMQQQFPVGGFVGKDCIRGFEFRAHARGIHATREGGFEHRMENAADLPVLLVGFGEFIGMCGIVVVQDRVFLILITAFDEGFVDIVAKVIAVIISRHPPTVDRDGGLAAKQRNTSRIPTPLDHITRLVFLVFGGSPIDVDLVPMAPAHHINRSADLCSRRARSRGADLRLLRIRT